ncbi:MAG TPA: 4Fe-4S dicluster domain-containing protein [Chloroflexi bacterium]|nr:4Fe-4S dicluster domain-containing protein [Chloroflexota bacterium]
MPRYNWPLLPEILRTLFNRPITVQYPFGPLEMPERYRGRVDIQAEKCRGCGLCVRDCPASALELERVDKETFRLIYHPDRCAYCGQCEESCRFDSIYLTNDFVPGTPHRENLTTVLVDRKPEEGEESGGDDEPA